jgi:hypothetical protein
VIKPAEVKERIHGTGYYKSRCFATGSNEFSGIDQLPVPVPVKGEKIPANDQPDKKLELGPACTCRGGRVQAVEQVKHAGNKEKMPYLVRNKAF